jgi:hypothetical protein
MKTAMKERDREELKKVVELTVIENKGRVINNSKLPVTCRYCELKWEQSSWC